jgi:hypothetical protein
MVQTSQGHAGLAGILGSAGIAPAGAPVPEQMAAASAPPAERGIAANIGISMPKANA